MALAALETLKYIHTPRVREGKPGAWAIQRKANQPGYPSPKSGQPAWADVKNREYHGWTVERIVLDTSGKTERECLNELLAGLPERPA